MIVVVVLAVLALAELAVIYLLQRANADERQRLLDRIQAPEASQIAALDAATGPRAPSVPAEEWEPVPTDDDLALADILDRHGVTS